MGRGGRGGKDTEGGVEGVEEGELGVQEEDLFLLALALLRFVPLPRIFTPLACVPFTPYMMMAALPFPSHFTASCLAIHVLVFGSFLLYRYF